MKRIVHHFSWKLAKVIKLCVRICNKPFCVFNYCLDWLVRSVSGCMIDIHRFKLDIEWALVSGTQPYDVLSDKLNLRFLRLRFFLKFIKRFFTNCTWWEALRIWLWRLTCFWIIFWVYRYVLTFFRSQNRILYFHKSFEQTFRLLKCWLHFIKGSLPILEDILNLILFAHIDCIGKLLQAKNKQRKKEYSFYIRNKIENKINHQDLNFRNQIKKFFLRLFTKVHQ